VSPSVEEEFVSDFDPTAEGRFLVFLLEALESIASMVR
jgi:hypothetical protein